MVSIQRLCCSPSCRVEFRTRRCQEELTAGCGQGAYVDEDDRWLWGIFYYNPRDTRVLINDRVGIGTSLNLARPAGKIVMGLSALLILAFPFVGPALEAAADRPISLTLEDGLLEASHGSTQYALAVEEVDRVELLEDLPDGLTRTGRHGDGEPPYGEFLRPGDREPAGVPGPHLPAVSSGDRPRRPEPAAGMPGCGGHGGRLEPAPGGDRRRPGEWTVQSPWPPPCEKHKLYKLPVDFSYSM